MRPIRVPMLNSKGYLELLDANPVYGPVYKIIFHFGNDDASSRYLDPKRLLYLLGRSTLLERTSPIFRSTPEPGSSAGCSKTRAPAPPPR